MIIIAQIVLVGQQILVMTIIIIIIGLKKIKGQCINIPDTRTTLNKSNSLCAMQNQLVGY